MKNKFWLIFSLFYSVLVVKMEGIPLSLPSGQSLYDITAAKSPCSVSIILQGINSSGGYSTAGKLLNNLSFNSYKDYMSFVVSNSCRLFNFLNGQCTNIHLNASMSYTNLNSDGNTALHTDLVISKDVQSIDDLQSLTSGLEPVVVIPITNLSNVVIQFSDGHTQNLELAGSAGFILDTSTLNSSERTRIKLSFSDGSVATYTQTGSLITPPIVSMLCIPYPPTYNYGYDMSMDKFNWNDWYYTYYGNVTICYPYYGYWNSPNQSYNYYYYNYWQPGYKPPVYQPINVVVQTSPGADVLIQSSVDLINWTDVMTIPWNSYINSALFPVDGYYISGNFFRAMAY